MAVAWCLVGGNGATAVETLRHPEPLEEQLRRTELGELARQVELRGNPERGALVFYKSAAGCVKCHSSGSGDPSPLGPDLAAIGRETTTESVVESLLFPSRVIREGYETVSVLTSDGRVLRGLVAHRDGQRLVLRDASDLQREVTIDADDVEAISAAETSMMPDGLVAVLGELRDFYDLAAYVSEVARGGPERARELEPDPDALLVADDTLDLDHAGILRGLRKRDFEAGEKIYHGYCHSCHGSDGDTPSLPSARAFGRDRLKFGADPYRLFLTLSRGNGMMAPVTHLTPKERYQAVHYIREAFMKDRNPDYEPVSADYLATLPAGSGLGDAIVSVDRDFGAALGSQLGRDVHSALTVDLGEVSISYDLHSMDVAGVWHGGFLDLDQTQHIRGRGEGTARPAGDMLDLLSHWRWGHDGTLDYPTDEVPPRGPMPARWLDYRGFHRHGRRIVLDYAIDGRPILEMPTEVGRFASATGGNHAVAHKLRIDAGPELVLAVTRAADHSDASLSPGTSPPAAEPVWLAWQDAGGATLRYFAASVRGDTAGMTWTLDDQGRLVLTIPASDDPRLIEVVRETGSGRVGLDAFHDRPALPGAPMVDPRSFVGGGPSLWPQTLSTVGYTGLERGAYRLDTLTIPDETPWNTWFRTSALDFFPDGRLVVTTYGGDVWIVSGVDRELLSLNWKRFAGGLYEPFGVKVIDGQIYVTCKDRVVRLHDTNGNGEADFYESFFPDPDVSVNFHAFNFDLQVDRDGYLYYAKSGHGADFDLPGAVFRVSPDGKEGEVYATGFRTPNGMGVLPDGRILASDNQGQWTPASKINLLRPGGFYGWVPTYSKPGMWAPGGGSIDLDRVVPPDSFDPPLIWMPQALDNSSGGQVFVRDSRWGPMAGRLLHTSFGKGWMFYLMTQDVGDLTQAAIVKLPFDFRTGIMRARVNPADGQVYATGLDGWNGGGRAGMLDQGIQRVVFTGKPHRMVRHCRVEPDGLRVAFNFRLDPSAVDTDAFTVEHWNYLWQASYGSDFYSPTSGKPGKERLEVRAVECASDGRSVLLRIPELMPVDQVHIRLAVTAADGRPFEEEIYWTIHAIPEGRDAP